jgi:hypothetical protein
MQPKARAMLPRTRAERARPATGGSRHSFSDPCGRMTNGAAERKGAAEGSVGVVAVAIDAGLCVDLAIAVADPASVLTDAAVAEAPAWIEVEAAARAVAEPEVPARAAAEAAVAVAVARAGGSRLVNIGRGRRMRGGEA